MKKVFIRTFGCQMNEYDSEKMLSVLAEGDDLVQVSEAEEADIILFNTCSVREKAQWTWCSARKPCTACRK